MREDQDLSSLERAPWQREAPRSPKSPNLERAPVIRRRRREPGPQVTRDIFKDRGNLSFTESTGFQSGPSAKRKSFALAMWSLFAALIDMLILISISSFFLMSFILILRTPARGILQGLLSHQQQMILFLQIFAGAAWVYLVSSRVLLGFTVGEWACDLRLGQPHERLRGQYILRVALRSTLIFLTGFVALPLVSLFFGKDLAGKISGIKLFSLK